jgi:hypothetical protein
MFTTNRPSPHNITLFCHELISLVSDEMMKKPNFNFVYEAAELLLLLLRMLPVIRGRLFTFTFSLPCELAALWVVTKLITPYLLLSGCTSHYLDYCVALAAMC